MTRGVDSLTLKVIGKDDSAIGADSFLEVIRETVALLRDLDTLRSLKWSVTNAVMQSPFSITFTAEQLEEAPPPPMPISQRYTRLFDLMDKGLPDSSSPAKAAVRAGRLTNTLNNGVLRIEMIARNEAMPVIPTQRVQATADELFGSRKNEYWEHTTLEGELGTISVEGGSKFFVVDRLTGQRSLCLIPHERINEAKNLLERRVWVVGKIRFRGNKAMRLEAEDFGAMPDRNALPQFSDIVGIDIAGAEDSATYVRRQRDAI
jgi:hypothetical protein